MIPDSELLDCATWDEGSLRATPTCYEYTLERVQDNVNKIKTVLALKTKPSAAEAAAAHRCVVGDDNCSKCGVAAWWERFDVV